ncbi:hypothetical protein IWQ60_011261 [Tieghemiomyces parasiticus]|uniref:CBS domain-containing protein n=1 Tax=Tieghemiomyces parasiticus TaxID=78921 RepID=A0A9W7ZNM1_9FUNG|nr:hypothetical protein IWQ60_011261 [Tieghemiomyces parasiticus]
MVSLGDPVTQEVDHFLNDRRIQDLLDLLPPPGRRPVVDVEETTPVERVFHTLADHDYQSLPVYRRTADGTKEYTGIVSVMDLLALLVLNENAPLPVNGTAAPTPSNSSPSTSPKKPHWEHVLSLPVSRALGDLAHQPHHCQVLKSSDPLRNLIGYFAQGGHYRAIVLADPADRQDVVPGSAAARVDDGRSGAPSASHEPARFVSRTDLVRYLWHHHAQFPALMDLSLPNFVNRIHGVVSPPASPTRGARHALAILQERQQERPTMVPMTTLAIDAFHLMHQRQVSALAIVDSFAAVPHQTPVDPDEPTGPLTSELAATHLRRLSYHQLGLLDKPVVAFLLATQDDVPTPFVVRTRFTFSQCLAGLLQTASRRAWLVDDMDDHPLAVISMADVLKAFVSST